MVELVDTLDLKSNDHYDRAGSSPASGTNCENSSVGRARPCQGRGRGFESRFSLSKGLTIVCKAFFVFKLHHALAWCFGCIIKLALAVNCMFKD